MGNNGIQYKKRVGYKRSYNSMREEYKNILGQEKKK